MITTSDNNDFRRIAAPALIGSRYDDTWCISVDVGWCVGAQATRKRVRRYDVIPTVLKTKDGEKTWNNVLGDLNWRMGMAGSVPRRRLVWSS